MTPPKNTNAKNIVRNTFGMSDIVVTTLNDAAISAPVPHLRQAAGLALEILNIVPGAKDNKDAFRNLAADTCQLVYEALCKFEEATTKGGDRGQSSGDLQGLLGKISSIERFSRKEVSRGAFFRLLRSKKSLGKIQDFRDSLQLSRGLFGLQYSVAMLEAASQLIDQNDEILQEFQCHREMDTAVTSVATPAPAAVERENGPVVPIPPVPPTLKAETPNPLGTVTHIEGDRIESHTFNNATSVDSGNTRITTTSNSNNDNSCRHYGGNNRPGAVRRGPRR